MLDKVIRFFISLTFAIGGGALMKLASPFLANYITTEFFLVNTGIFRLTLITLLCILVGALLGALGGRLVSPYLVGKLRNFSAFVEKQIGKMPMQDVIAGVAGLAIGLIIADLLGNAFARIPVVGDYFPLVFSIIFGYIGIRVTIKKRSEITATLEGVPRKIKEILRNRDGEDKNAPPVAQATEKPAEVATPENVDSPQVDSEKPANNKNYKLLDTNVIIDGRIADICDTGFLEGTLLIPVFVLEELQHIADSPDNLRRVRGRRGLDVLQKIREESGMEVEVMNVDFDDIQEVDSKLVRLAQKVGGKIVTNDFNLNKVAQLRGVRVLNINDLSNAVKPVVVPGETMRVQVVKDGKEPGQGVAYLDDGTMIVVENGHKFMSKTISVEVTSALQTSAGRMIFAKPR